MLENGVRALKCLKMTKIDKLSQKDKVSPGNPRPLFCARAR